MLLEEKNVRQVPGEPPRRWFADGYFDLIIWLQPDGGVWGFQLCYDRENKPRALTWTAAGGYRHSGIDDGEGEGGRQKASPVLVEDGLFDAGGVAARFRAEAGDVPARLAAFVAEKLEGFRE
jgi:hypothetical protein